MTPRKLIATGDDDNGSYQFRFPVDLVEFPVEGLQLALRTARHIVGDLELEIARRGQTAPSAVEPDRLLSAAEAAPMLDTTEDHVWSMMRRGTLPCVFVGRKYKRVPLSAIQALVQGKPLPPVKAPAQPRSGTPRIGRTAAASLPK